eukprot:EG_transcript_17882
MVMGQIRALGDELRAARARAAESEAALCAAQARNAALEALVAGQRARLQELEQLQPCAADRSQHADAKGFSAPRAAIAESPVLGHAPDGLFEWLCAKKDELERCRQTLADQEAGYLEAHAALVGELEESTERCGDLAGLLQDMQRSMALKRRLTVVVAALAQVEAKLNGVADQRGIVAHCLGFWTPPAAPNPGGTPPDDASLPNFPPTLPWSGNPAV